MWPWGPHYQWNDGSSSLASFFQRQIFTMYWLCFQSGQSLWGMVADMWGVQECATLWCLWKGEAVTSTASASAVENVPPIHPWYWVSDGLSSSFSTKSLSLFWAQESQFSLPVFICIPQSGTQALHKSSEYENKKRIQHCTSPVGAQASLSTWLSSRVLWWLFSA